MFLNARGEGIDTLTSTNFFGRLHQQRIASTRFHSRLHQQRTANTDAGRGWKYLLNSRVVFADSERRMRTPPMDQDNRARVGRTAPSFTGRAVINGKVRELSLDAITKDGYWLLLCFFPKAFSIICPSELLSFSDRWEEFITERKCKILFVSTDTDSCLRAWTKLPISEGGVGDINIPLMSDMDHHISKAYGVLMKDRGITERASFIIDCGRRVRSIVINDEDVGRSVNETQRRIDAIHWTDSYGQSCPTSRNKVPSNLGTSTVMPIENVIPCNDKCIQDTDGRQNNVIQNDSGARQTDTAGTDMIPKEAVTFASPSWSNSTQFGLLITHPSSV